MVPCGKNQSAARNIYPIRELAFRSVRSDGAMKNIARGDRMSGLGSMTNVHPHERLNSAQRIIEREKRLRAQKRVPRNSPIYLNKQKRFDFALWI